ncbi:MAG: cell wall-binding repeat-containing protein [Erysipelotrichaceae bacterium]|nr:cell wall-binding repeat-containing protein [Erysipelotrichaceae bacterium]
MKKRITLFLCILAAVLSLCSTTVLADGGWADIKDLRISSSGILKWKEVEGAAEYEVWTDDGLLLGYVSPGETHETFLEYLRLGSAPTGKYKATVYALDDWGTVIARSTTKESVSYTANGTTPNVPYVYWQDATIARWNRVEGDEVFYYVYLYGPSGMERHVRTSETSYNFDMYMFKDYHYYYTVVAGQAGHTRSGEESVYGPSTSNRRIVRLAGVNRYETALLAADEVIKNNEPAYFENIIIANGDNFPDALSGTYLALMYSCPLVLINESKAATVCEYLNNKLVDDAHISIIGGQNAVKDSWLKGISKKSRVFERLEGSNRYKTNLEILKQGYLDAAEILVATGKNFADALSASATGLPLLLVGDKLEDYQKDFLKKIQSPTFTIIGGKNAVSEQVEKDLAKYGTVEKRLAGDNRYETSSFIAYQYFSPLNHDNQPDFAVLATGANFPDGLSGGPLAWSVGNSPLLLIDPTGAKDMYARGYGADIALEQGYILGGENAVPDKEAVKILMYGAWKR